MIQRTETLVEEITGAPIAGAKIHVYNQDGTVATLTSDGTTPLTQPVISDEFGAYSYYAATGYYNEDIFLGSRRIWEQANIAIGSPGADLALRTDLAALTGGMLIGDPISGTVKARLDLIDLRTGTKNEGTLPAAGASLTPFVINKTASGNADGLGDWRAQVEVANYTGAYGAAQINADNTQLNILHSAGTVAFVVGRQGYVAIGTPSTPTTTGDVSRADWMQGHISHTGSGALAFSTVFSALGLDADVGVGTIGKFHAYHSDDIAPGSGTRLQTEGFGYFQANCTAIGGSAILAGYGCEISFGTNRWSIYFSGGASSWHAGRLRIGGTSAVAPTDFLEVVGGIRACTQGTTIASIGFSTGAGGAITQATSKSTGVALDKPCGQITMNNAALAAGAKVSFVVTNSLIAATDTIIVSVASGGTANAYRAAVTAISAGVSFTITVENITGGSLSEAPIINFAIIKAVAA